MNYLDIILIAIIVGIVISEVCTGFSVKRDMKRLKKENEQSSNESEIEKKLNGIKNKIVEISELKNITEKYKVNDGSRILLEKQTALIEYLNNYYTQYCIASFRFFVANELTIFYKEYKTNKNSFKCSIEELFTNIDKKYDELKHKKNINLFVFENKCKEIIENIKECVLEIEIEETNNIIKSISPIDDTADLTSKIDNILLFKESLCDSNKKLDDEYNRFYAEISLNNKEI